MSKELYEKYADGESCYGYVAISDTGSWYVVMDEKPESTQLGILMTQIGDFKLYACKLTISEPNLVFSSNYIKGVPDCNNPPEE